MNRIIEIEPLADYYLRIRFNDGLEVEVNLRPFIGKGFTAELLAIEKFNEVFIEEGGGIAWPNGYDFCPNFLRELAEQKELIS